MSSQLSIATDLKNWKAFVFERDGLLLHIPSSHILSVTVDFALAVEKGSPSPEQFIALQQIEAEIPLPDDRKKPVVDITAIALNVEQGCNLRCTYCYAGDGDYGRNSKMTMETAIAVLEKLSTGKDQFHIAFFGGEPLLNFELIVDVVAWCKLREKTKFTFSITTNAVLLRKPIMEFFKKNKFGVTISYDGKKIQEKQRKGKEEGMNTSSVVGEKITTYLKELKELGGFKLRATIAKDSVDDFEQSLAGTLSDFDASLAFSIAAEDKHGNRYTPADINTVGAALATVVEKLIVEEEFDDIMRISTIKYMVDMFQNGVVNSNYCGAATNYISVGTNGNFYICHRFTEDKSANIGNYKDGLNLQMLGEINTHRMGKDEPCKSCWMRNFCGGGCYHENKLATESFTKIDRMFCQLQDIEMKVAMRVYNFLLEKRPDLL